MSKLARRQNTAMIISSSKFGPAASYTVFVSKVGAEVNGDVSSGTTVTVFAGHGFSDNDKFIVGTDNTLVYTVSTAAATTLTVSATITSTISDNSLLFNLGPDTASSGTPDYDASPVTIYTEMDGTTADADSIVSCSSTGEYSYWYYEPEMWELVRDTDGDPVDIITDVTPYDLASTKTGLTASTTQSQAGGLALLASINEISTVANASDTVVLPEARPGRTCTVINNGAFALQIFPASGDNLGGSVDAAMLTDLAVGEMITFYAYDYTNWQGFRGTAETTA